MKVAVPLGKNILPPLGITAAIDAGINKKTWFWDSFFNSFKQRNQWHNKNCSSS